jgi:hypothetical protein
MHEVFRRTLNSELFEGFSRVMKGHCSAPNLHGTKGGRVWALWPPLTRVYAAYERVSIARYDFARAATMRTAFTTGC